MTTMALIESAVVSWVQGVSSQQASINWDGGPEIRESHIGIFISSVKHSEWGTESFSNTGSTQTTTRQAAVKILISCRGHNAQQMASRLISSLAATGRYKDIWRVGGRGAVSETRDLTALETGAVQGRVEFDLTLNCALTETFTHDYFNSILINVYETQKGLVATIDGGTDPHPPEDCN